jgi:hypothetical protein
MIPWQLVQTRETNRQDILDAFEEIPGIVHMAYTQSKRFPESLTLHQHIDRFKCNLCDAIPCLIDILVPGTFRLCLLSQNKLTLNEANKMQSYEDESSISWVQNRRPFAPSPRKR